MPGQFSVCSLVSKNTNTHCTELSQHSPAWLDVHANEAAAVEIRTHGAMIAVVDREWRLNMAVYCSEWRLN